MVEILTVKSDAIKYNWTFSLNSKMILRAIKNRFSTGKKKIEENTINSHIFLNVVRQCAFWLSSKINSFIWPINEIFCSPYSLQCFRTSESHLCSLEQKTVNSGLKCSQWCPAIAFISFIYQFRNL